MNISGNMPMKPAMLSQQQMQERFIQADTNESGGLTIEEMKASAPEGKDLVKLEQHFSRMDSNGDGEVTSAEHQQAMEARMAKLESKNSDSNGYQTGLANNDMLTDLFNSIAKNNTLNDEQQTQIQSLLDKLASGSTENIIDESAAILQEVIPSINLTA